MNAHINLDLGIAAAEVSKNQDLNALKGDFDKINEVLSDLVNEVQNELIEIWPTLKKILKWTKGIDDFMVDFSMKLARDGAWKFAKEVYETSPENLSQKIAARDAKIVKNVRLVFPRNLIIRSVFTFVRLGEKGKVPDRIKILAN